MKTTVLIILTIFFGNSIKGQTFEDEIRKEDIQIHTSLIWNNNNPKAASTYIFGKDGKIRHIYKGILNPVYSNKDKNYYAKYEYSNSGKLLEEQLYESDTSNFILLRTTNYKYEEDSTVVITRAQKEGKLLAEIVEYKEGNNIKRINKLDIVLGQRNPILNNSIAVYEYEKGKLKTINLRSNENGGNIKILFQHKKRTSLISTELKNDTSLVTYHQFRFYDKIGRLSKISGEKNKNKWHIKFCYGKTGMISKIIRRGRMHKSRKKVRSTILFDANISKKTSGKEYNSQSIIFKLNEEIINMYYPITGIHNLNHLDSRRFISHRG